MTSCLLSGTGAEAQSGFAPARSVTPPLGEAAPSDPASVPAESEPDEVVAEITQGPLAPSRAVVPRHLHWALIAARAGDYDRAAQIALRDGPVAVDIIEWTRLRDGEGSAQEVLDFLGDHGDWPGLDLLRSRNEGVFAAADAAQVLAFFHSSPPETGLGTLAYADALRQQGQGDAADAVLIAAWRNLRLSPTLQATFLVGNQDLLAPYHGDRLNMLYWASGAEEIQAMKDVAKPGDWALAQAIRLARVGAEGADAAIAALPAEDRLDGTLAYARFRARVAQGRTSDAKTLMVSQSRIPGGLDRPDAWASERRAYVREEMRAGNNDLAYDLAAHHQLTAGGNFADLEWLAGYIALQRLDQPEVALGHFERLRGGVETPISLGRAYYWIGRAQEALGDKAAAQAAYRAGGAHQTSFYGLLAAEKAGMPSDPTLAGAPSAVRWQGADFAGSDLRQAAALLRSAGEGWRAELFLLGLSNRLDEDGFSALGAMAEDWGDAHLQVMIGKWAAGRGIVLPRHYYALHPLAGMDLPVHPELALAIARRESEFDPAVMSGAGAGGLMQLMPGTARDMARDLGVTDHSQARLTEDWQHNAALGSAYLADLGQRFGGNVLLMSVGYNAGPGRAEQWLQSLGDPRDPEVDVVDWIEAIPYRETRNYVQRVAESLPVYRARLGLDPRPVPFSVELKGSTLLPLAPKGE
ncbi:lytic transglycosylase domain-containing protein [Pseudooceanicola algae]|uniref:lytic transglycosylase domain-containing protein n=1 Tax=Pseudooceanicola algae TaxID=1537215 RepID=UPI001E5062B3|nr:lytic transglycosylase domain-containing protein [Pseudooceanicola algae]